MFRCENVVTDHHYDRSECLKELSAKLNSLEEDYGDIQIIDIDKSFKVDKNIADYSGNVFLEAVIIFKDNVNC